MNKDVLITAILTLVISFTVLIFVENLPHIISAFFFTALLVSSLIIAVEIHNEIRDLFDE